MAIIINGVAVDLPGCRALSWHDDPTLRLHFPLMGVARRQLEVQAVVLHTTRGDRSDIVLDGEAPPEACTARATVRAWQRGDRHAGAHLVVDADGTLLCLGDLAREVAYHCVGCNGTSVGVEVVQQPNGAIYRRQVEVVVALVQLLTERLRVPRRVAWPYRGARAGMELARGVFGHRDASNNRGAGDPGDVIMGTIAALPGWVQF